MEPKPERLQKILAAAGLASRRKAEQLIAAGAVSVNGHVITEPGTKADPRLDEIRVDGKLLRGPERHVYLALYKPKGTMTTVSDPEGRPTVMDLIKGVEERVFPVGRLDYMSEGLLLLTNDGDLMAQLTKAGSHVAKTYVVKVSGKPTEEEIEKLRKGIMLPPEPGLTGVRGKKQPGVERRSFAVLTQPADIQLAVDQENPWYEVTLTEGRNRQIRRMFEQIGYHIEKIKRVRYGSLTLDLEPGEFRHLTPKEVNQLRKSLDVPFKPKPVKVKRKDQRPERKPRVDAARFVKGRRGKPSADAPAPSSSAAFRAAAGRDSAPPRRSSTRPGDGEQRRSFDRPRGPEFKREERPEGEFTTRRPHGSRPGRDSKPFDRERGPKREGKFDKREGGTAKRADAYAKRAPRRDDTFEERPRTRDNSKAGDFGFSRFTKPKFSKPSKHRDLGSDHTHDFSERKSFGDRPAGERDRKRPGSFGGDRKYSKGPGKPASGESRGRTGDFKRTGSDFKRNAGDFKRSGEGSKRSGGDVRRSGEGRPASRPGRFGTPSGGGRSFGGGERRGPSSSSGFGGKRPANRGSASRPPRRRPDQEE